MWLPQPSVVDFDLHSFKSILGGVTVVQIREKDADTQEVCPFSYSVSVTSCLLFQFIDIAKASKAICDKYSVPMFINDRVDVALAVNAFGVHIGQTDMSVSQARALLPEGAVIGVSCNNVQHVKAAIEDGVDYIGIGGVYNTKTKTLTDPIIGVRGVGAMLEALDGTRIKAVAIGECRP